LEQAGARFPGTVQLKFIIMKKIKILVPCFGHIEGQIVELKDKDADWAVENKKAEYVKEPKNK